VVLTGEAKMKTTSVDELKHYAEDAKKPQAEIDAITKPEKEIRFTASLQKEEQVDKLLRQFEATQSVSFEIVGNQIIIK
ncbi:MAG: DUF4920 domain-containing protein, partial [Odoribacter sp.]